MSIAFFREHDDYKLFRSQQSFFLHDFVSFSEKSCYCDEYWWDDLLRKNVNNVFCVLSRCEMWSEKYDTNFFVQKSLITIRSWSCEMWSKIYDTNFFMQILFCDDSFSWFCLIISSLVFWLFNLDSTNDVYSFLICRATYVFLMRRLKRLHFIKLKTIHHLRTT